MLRLYTATVFRNYTCCTLTFETNLSDEDYLNRKKKKNVSEYSYFLDPVCGGTVSVCTCARTALLGVTLSLKSNLAKATWRRACLMHERRWTGTGVRLHVASGGDGDTIPDDQILLGRMLKKTVSVWMTDCRTVNPALVVAQIVSPLLHHSLTLHHSSSFRSSFGWQTKAHAPNTKVRKFMFLS